METIQQPALKRSCPNYINKNPFPISDISEEKLVYKYTGYFTGTGVEIFDAAAIKALFENGSFGISSKTKAVPLIIHKQKTSTRKQCDQQLALKKELVLNENANNISEKDFTKQKTTKTEVQHPFDFKESLVLFLEESFFLHYALRCLNIIDFNCKKILSTDEILNKFCKIKPNFITYYVSYHYLRSKNWVIKSGIKFGGDFLLYKKSPRYYHASYVVIVQKYNETTNLEISPSQIHGMCRIGETSKKQLLICEIYWPNKLKNEQNASPMTCLLQLDNFNVSEITPIRFNFNQQRAQITAASTSNNYHHHTQRATLK